jgi:hypothetical protein
MPILTEDDWDAILNAVAEGDCVPFLGAGASLGFEGRPGLPTAKELAVDLAKLCQYEGADPEDFLRVCQYYELKKKSRSTLRQHIIKKLTVPGVEPGTIHRTLASLPVTHVITTNYDCLMERAFEEVGKSPKVAVHDIISRISPKVPSGTSQNPIVYKMHGTMKSAATMICTEDDAVQFLAGLFKKDPGLPATIQTLFEERSLLFIGYGLRDWNIRVLIRALRYRKGMPIDWTQSFAIQRRPNKPEDASDWEHTLVYWESRENIKCFDVDAAEFALELGRRFQSRISPPSSAPPPTPAPFVPPLGPMPPVSGIALQPQAS